MSFRWLHRLAPHHFKSAVAYWPPVVRQSISTHFIHTSPFQSSRNFNMSAPAANPENLHKDPVTGEMISKSYVCFLYSTVDSCVALY